jgi:hypothetical protein
MLGVFGREISEPGTAGNAVGRLGVEVTVLPAGVAPLPHGILMARLETAPRSTNSSRVLAAGITAEEEVRSPGAAYLTTVVRDRATGHTGPLHDGRALPTREEQLANGSEAAVLPDELLDFGTIFRSSGAHRRRNTHGSIECEEPVE